MASDLILTHLGKTDGKVSYKEAEAFTTRDKKIDVRKAIEQLEHETRVSLAEGLPRTLDWMRQVYGIGPS